MQRITFNLEGKENKMKTIIRHFKPRYPEHGNIRFKASQSVTELIKIADEYCKNYGFDYEEPIYKVITGSENHNTNTYSYSKLDKLKFKKDVHIKEQFYYEARLRKVV